MSMKDVREFLIKQMAELAGSDGTPEEQAQVIERAKASSTVAQTYIQAVKVEIEAIKLLDETGRIPVAVEAPPMSDHNAKVLSFEGKQRA
jgi:hypothetical protein